MEKHKIANATLHWGPTPANDEWSRAAMLDDVAGSASGTNRYATLQRGERPGLLGHSSLWWVFEAPEAGWYRFWIDGSSANFALSVYEAGDRVGSLNRIEASRRPDERFEPADVIFYADAGSRYAIRLGTHGSAEGEDFTLRWSKTEPQARLRYLGRIASGFADAAGKTVELRNLGDLTFGQEALYVASEPGLLTFKRNSENGRLTHLQTVDGGLRDHALVWDARRNRLLATGSGCGWKAFARESGSSPTVGRAQPLRVAGNYYCDAQDLVIDANGAFLYSVVPLSSRLEAFAIESAGGLRLVQSLEIPSLAGALLGKDEQHGYAVTDEALLAFARNAATGTLAQLNSRSLNDSTALALGDHGRLLFVVQDNGWSAAAFDVTDSPGRPVERAIGIHNDPVVCQHVSARPGLPAADVFCGPDDEPDAVSGAYAVQLRESHDNLSVSDRVYRADRFENLVPDFGVPKGLATSPDGRHIYLTTAEHGILIFERVGSQTAESD